MNGQQRQEDDGDSPLQGGKPTEVLLVGVRVEEWEGRGGKETSRMLTQRR